MNLTFKESIFLHLLEHNNQRNCYVVTDLITQKGIQRIFQCNLSHVSRTIKEKENDGYIYRKKVIINGNQRKQFAFFLTQKGKKTALEIRNKLIWKK